MKTHKFNKLLSLAVLFVFVVLPRAEAAPKFRMAIINATSDAKLLKQSDLIANNFIKVIAKSESFAVVEREELR